MELTSLLGRYGFTEKEAKIYLAALEVGSAPASSIARRTRENRVTVYSALKSMKQKGIVYETQTGGITYYGAVEPQQLLVEEQQKISLLEQKMPEFMALMHMGVNKPKFQYFEGLEGLKQLYQDTLLTTEGIRAFLSTAPASKELSTYLNTEYVPQRVQKNIFAKVILPHSQQDVLYAADDLKSCRETKIITHELFSISIEINIYAGNKVALVMFSEGEMSGVIISSKSFHDTLGSMFEVFWLI